MCIRDRYGSWGYSNDSRTVVLIIYLGRIIAGTPAGRAEAKEEADVDVELDRLLGVYSNDSRTVVLIIYLGRIIAGTPAGRAEALDARLFALNALPKLAFDHDSRILNDFLPPKTDS